MDGRSGRRFLLYVSPATKWSRKKYRIVWIYIYEAYSTGDNRFCQKMCNFSLIEDGSEKPPAKITDCSITSLVDPCRMLYLFACTISVCTSVLLNWYCLTTVVTCCNPQQSKSADATRAGRNRPKADCVAR
jgi:hypothetical protein